jgi:hypothetical protein
MLRMRDRRVTTRAQHKHVQWLSRELRVNARLKDVMDRKLREQEGLAARLTR